MPAFWALGCCAAVSHVCAVLVASVAAFADPFGAFFLVLLLFGALCCLCNLPVPVVCVVFPVMSTCAMAASDLSKCQETMLLLMRPH